jgi:uncharacterized membrane protein YvlD (DUF360 family)
MLFGKRREKMKTVILGVVCGIIASVFAIVTEPFAPVEWGIWGIFIWIVCAVCVGIGSCLLGFEMFVKEKPR